MHIKYSIFDALPFGFYYGLESVDVPGKGWSVDDVFIIDVLSIDEFIIELFAILSLNAFFRDERLAFILPFHPFGFGAGGGLKIFPDLSVFGVSGTGGSSALLLLPGGGGAGG